MNYLHKKGNNKHNQGGNMNNFISRLFVVCLLFSVVTEVSAQDRNIDKSGAKQEIKKGKDKVKKGNAGSSSRVDSDTKSGNSSSGVKSKANNPGGKLGPGGSSSARLSGDTVAPKSGKSAKKGFLGRLFSRSSKTGKAAGKAAGKGSANSPSAGEKVGEKPRPTETDPRDKP
tara:strand:+ start:1012 stop:1527 length:516 start_codon:yes stop_codon:yes gene_type:complete